MMSECVQDVLMIKIDDSKPEYPTQHYPPEVS